MKTLLVNDGDISRGSRLSQARDWPPSTPTTASVWRRACIEGLGITSPSKAEALGIATEFAPSVLVARLLSASGFALGATMAFRKSDLKCHWRIRRNPRLPRRRLSTGRAHRLLWVTQVVLSDSVVETSLGRRTWADVWNHQVRWSRTIRISRPAGYFGYLVTQLTFWCLVAALFGYGQIALMGLIFQTHLRGRSLKNTRRYTTVPCSACSAARFVRACGMGSGNGRPGSRVARFALPVALQRQNQAAGIAMRLNDCATAPSQSRLGMKVRVAEP